MNQKNGKMLRIVLIRPGETDFDEQGRIKGTLDIPLNERGGLQVDRTADDLEDIHIERIYCSPCLSAEETAKRLSAELGIKVKTLDNLANLDHGLWQGKLISEVKQTQPKVYRRWQDSPETVCPPNGETVSAARDRVRKSLKKLLRRHRSGVVALVVPEPLASMVRSLLEQSELGDMWQAERDDGHWQLIDVEPRKELLV